MYSYTPNKKNIFFTFPEMDRHFDVIVECKVSKVISQERLTKYICKNLGPPPALHNQLHPKTTINQKLSEIASQFVSNLVFADIPVLCSDLAKLILLVLSYNLTAFLLTIYRLKS